MKLKENIPIYNDGDQVTILDKLEDRLIPEDFRDAGYDEGNMSTLQGRVITIRGGQGGGYYFSRDTSWTLSANMFKESYDDITTPEVNELYEGMYLYHEGHLMNSSRPILLQIDKINKDRIKCYYIFRNDAPAEQYELALKLSSCRHIYNIDVIKLKFKDGRNHISSEVFIPSNEELMEEWKVTNKVAEVVLKEGHLMIPDLFSYSKYPIRKITYYSSGRSTTKDYYFEIKPDLLVSYNNDKYKSVKPGAILERKLVNKTNYKELIVQWGKVKIKSFEESSALFGHKTRKKAMFDAVLGIAPKSGKSISKVYKVSNVIFNYEKEGKFYHVLEVNDGTLNLKFLLSDLELILPNVNNYVLPKDRVIKKGDTCKIVKDKLLPFKRNEKVKVLSMFNRHTPQKGVHVFDKDSVCIVVGSNNKEFECKVKQLKRI